MALGAQNHMVLWPLVVGVLIDVVHLTDPYCHTPGTCNARVSALPAALP